MIALDASALLAVMLREPGREVVEPVLRGAIMSTVNISEVFARIGERGGSIELAEDSVAAMEIELVDFDPVQAGLAARLRASTRHLGLSFGDRACLALGNVRNARIMTADRAWAKLDIGVDIVAIR